MIPLDPASGEFPEGVAVDKAGNLWVTIQPLCQVRDKPAELWVEGGPLVGNLPLPPGFPPLNFPLGANGIVFYQDRLIVAVTYMPRLVSIPVNHDGSAGTPEILVGPPAFFGRQIYSLDGLALDVHGNFYLASPSNRAVVRISSDGSDIAIAAASSEGITAAPLSLAFGAVKGDRQSLFVTVNQSYGGSGSGVVRVPVGSPGMPLP